MWRTCICLGIVIVAVGCGSTAEPEGAWSTGSVVARDVRIPIGDPPSIHVKETPTDECGIIFLVRPSTSIRQQGAGLASRVVYSDLVVGTQVRVRAQIILDSCPGQSTADVIEIQR